jgi:hypothetical protein
MKRDRVDISIATFAGTAAALLRAPGRDAAAFAGVRRALLAAAIAAGAITGPAQAAIVVGSFDPAFGAAIPNLGFRGTVTAFVPDACFAQPAGAILDTDPCSNGGMAVLTTSVDFYNVNTPGQPGFAALNPAPAFPPGGVVGVVTGFDGVSQQNELLGIDTGTTYSQWISVDLADPGPTASAADDVAFSSSMRLRFYADPLSSPPSPGAPAYAAVLEACANLETGPFCVESNPAATVFQRRATAVPEPASAALVAAALAAVLAAALVRRRRRLPGGASDR